MAGDFNLMKLNTEVEVYTSENDLISEERKILEHAKLAVTRAYAPYSNFHVGAAILLENGKIIEGNNQENAAYPSGLCAERVALFSASSEFPSVAIKSIAVTCKVSGLIITEPVTPCGACRQVIAEYEEKFGKAIRIIMSGEKGKVYVCNGINQLLPLQFNSKQLKNK